MLAAKVVRSTILICPGIHDPQLTQNFLDALQREGKGNLSNNWTDEVLIFPTQDYPAYSAVSILEFLQHHFGSVETPIIFISFSAGVAGGIGAAWGWQSLGGKVKAFIAFDGWGVPLYGDYPIHRISHDYFTHWSSALLGSGEDSFYADRAIAHLELWGKPDICQGWWVHSTAGGMPEQRTFTTVARFVSELLRCYKEPM